MTRKTWDFDNEYYNITSSSSRTLEKHSTCLKSIQIDTIQFKLLIPIKKIDVRKNIYIYFVESQKIKQQTIQISFKDSK